MSYDKQDLEEMLSSGQVIRTEKLLTILHQNGFSTRRPGGGSSHIFFGIPTILTFLPIRSLRKPIIRFTSVWRSMPA